MSEAGAATAAGADLQQVSAARLIRRYRELLWVIAAPLFALLLLLAVWQGLQARRAAVVDLERRAAAYHAATQGLAKVATDHVSDLRTQLERDLLTLPRPPDAALRSMLQPVGNQDGVTLDDLPQLLRPGLSQLLWLEPGAGPDDDVLWRLQSMAQLSEQAHNRSAELARTQFIGWPQRHALIYPWVPSRLITEPTGKPTLIQAGAELYKSQSFLASTPERNPAHSAFWTAVHKDATGLGLVVSQAAPVYAGEAFRGVVTTDIKLSMLTQALAVLPQGPGRWWVVSDSGEVLAEADPREAVSDASKASSAAGETLPHASERLPRALDRDARRQALQGGGRAVAINGYRVVALDVASAPWTVVFALSETEVLAEVLPGLLPFALIALALLAMFLHGQWLLRQRVISPALGIMGYLEAKSRDDATPEPVMSARWQPWVRVVTETFRAQKEARERERRSEAFKSAIVDNALAAIVASDADGRIVEFNPSAEAMFLRPRASVMGRRVAELFVPERYRASHEAGMQRLREGHAPQMIGKRRELTALRGDGSEFPIDIILWRTEVDGGLHYTASITDISARRDAAQQIERQRELLRQSEKLSAMGVLLAGVAHELNNPLAIVMGRASLLEEKCEQMPDMRDDAHRIHEAAERCGRIVRTFLNMARARPPSRGNVSLNDLVRAAADMLAYSFRTHGVALKLEMSEALPTVNADEDQIGQVVLNLLVNAQHALMSFAGERRVEITTGVETRRDGREPRVWLRVSDNGPGVDIALREKIFEPFFSTKPEGVGTGLGLSVSRSMAREHGGDLVIEAPSAEGGATFRLSLPISGPADAGSRPDGSDEADAPERARLLVVDDEPEIADLMRAIFEGAGYDVATAESGEVALELLEMARFDAIVSDLRMPDMDGAALWREISKRRPALATRMLFVTGDTLSIESKQFLAASRCISVDKPFTRADLLARVGALIAKGRG